MKNRSFRSPDKALRILLDQNIPYPVKVWLCRGKSGWDVFHVKDIGLEGKSDSVLFQWAQKNEALIVTYDEDFADSRFYPLGSHHGVIRLKNWPTTIDKTIHALTRLFESTPESDLQKSLVIVDNQKIRIRKI